jgi:beta-lactam-binding protein with PASTA domain
MSRWKILQNKEVCKHIAIVIGAGIVLLILVFSSLNIYTHHGQSTALPDFKGLTETQLQTLVKSRKLRYTIIDSVHIGNAPKGVVVEQVPKAGELVKKKRLVFLTINAWTEEQVAVPNLTDYSYRNAREILESFGLTTGDLVYIPSEYTNLVLGQHFQGKPVEPGTMVPKGTAIDLLIGRGLSSETTPVPNLIGLDLNNAREIIQNYYLNIGATIYTEDVITVEDSAKAFIWKQNPPSETGYSLHLGSSIDVWLTIDEVLLQNEPDSLIEDSSFEDEIL